MKVTLSSDQLLINRHEFFKGLITSNFIMSNMDWTWPRDAPGLGPAYSGLFHLWAKQRSNCRGQRMRW